MNSERVFQILLVAGLLAGGWLYGDYWKKSGLGTAGASDAPELRARNSELVQEVDRLEDELAEVRSLLASGPYPVPDELIAWIEKEHHMVFLKSPDVRLASPNDFREAALNNLQMVHGEEALQQEGLAWELLGLLPPNQQLLTQLLFINSSGLKGVFDMTTGQVLLAQGFDPVSVLDRSVLVRLLGRQLSFQNHPRKKWSTRDQWQAWEATHVGAAAALQSRFLQRNLAAREKGPTIPEPQREELLNDLAPALQGFCNFPYLEGADYARFFYLDSRQAWGEMFRHPPETTRLILHPNSAPRPGPKMASPQEAGEVVFANDLGELGLRLWLEPFIGNDQADEFSAQWTGDLYRLIKIGRSQGLTWQIQLTTSEFADELAREIERSIFPILREMQPIRSFSLSRDEARLTIRNFPESK